MKNLILAFVLVFCAAPALAEDYTMTTYYPAPEGVYDKLSANTIGVGTTSPQTQFHVIGRAFIDFSAAAHSVGGSTAALTVDQDPGAGSGMLTLRDSGMNTRLTVDITNGFRTYTALGAETARITPAGNVGIGINAPQAKLDISGGASTTFLRLAAPGNFVFATMTTNAAGSPSFWLDNPASNQDILLNPDGPSYFRFGNVGIGQTNPVLARLDVNQGSGLAPGSAIKFGARGFLVSPNTIISDNAYWNGGAWVNVNNAVSAAMDLTNGQVNFLTATAAGIPNWTYPFTITNAGNVGIGVQAPASALHVQRPNVDAAVIVERTGFMPAQLLLSAQANAGIMGTLSNNSLFFATNNTLRMVIDTAGKVGIGGGLLPTDNLSVTGTIRSTSDISAGTGAAPADMYAGAFLHLSDERVKQNITPLTNALDKVQAMKGVYFNYTGQSRKQVGLIAQDVEKVVPEVVVTGADGMKALDYSNLVAVLIEAVKEQETKIDALEKELKAQRADLETFKKAHE